MNAGIKHWLPADAFLGDAAREALREPIAAWSAHWFAHEVAAVSRLRWEQDGRPPAGQQGLQSGGANVFLDMSGVGKRHLLEAALGFALAEQVRSQYDAHVLDVFAADIVDDLVARLDAAWGGDLSANAAPDLKATLAIGTNDLLDIAVPSVALVPKMKAWLGGARPAAHRLGHRGEALRKTRVTARGCLGHAQIALHELRELGVGDVLVLDRSLNEPVELCLSASNQAFARGALRAGDGQLSIQL